MLNVLANRTFAALFSAQLVALIGTGLMTVALGLLAFDLAGPSAGAVLGTALTIKMVAYVLWAPVAGAIAETVPRKVVLIGTNLIRAAIALALPFVEAIWQVYLLIGILQIASASFTPAFQATIPDVLPDERDYTRALSLSRLAYDLENLLSPALAGLLLLVMEYHWLFTGTVVGFLASAALVWQVQLPSNLRAKVQPFAKRLTWGVRIYLATPRLRGLLALNLAAAASVAFVLVNTVVVVRAEFGLGDAEVAMTMAAFGSGSMLTALLLPRWLDARPDRPVMIAGAVVLSALTLGHALVRLLHGAPGWPATLVLWAALGLAYSAVLTPSGRLLRRSARSADLPAIFAAQFALSHACWLVAYPVAGWAGDRLSLGLALLILGGLSLVGTLLAIRLWPAHDPEIIAHSHPELPHDHPHLREGEGDGAGAQHSHHFVIDEEHRVWPTQG